MPADVEATALGIPAVPGVRQGYCSREGQGRAAFIGLVALLLGLPLTFTVMVVTFMSGYIPYIAAFLGGGLAVIVALGEGGIDTAAIMLVAVAASNLLLENFVEPKVMSHSLDIHPSADSSAASSDSSSRCWPAMPSPRLSEHGFFN